LLQSYLEFQQYLEATTETWAKAARIYFELRRKGKTVRSPIDCCIAQIAINEKALLLHRDQDFTIISGHRELQHQFVDWGSSDYSSRQKATVLILNSPFNSASNGESIGVKRQEPF